MPSLETVVYPVYYRLVVRRRDSWYFTKGDIFVNLFNIPVLDQKDLFACFGTNMNEVANKLKIINGGKEGFYLANIQDKKYYYCGQEWPDVKTKLQELGIGRPEPMAN